MKKQQRKRLLLSLLLIISLVFLAACVPQENSQQDWVPEEGASYLQAEEVAAYLYLYQDLPPNYLTKKEAADQGWDAQAGNLWEVQDQASIGGDVFGNRENKLPEQKGRRWYECDVNYAGGYRGPERLVYSNDGLIYYTADHYNSFELWYEGEEGENVS